MSDELRQELNQLALLALQGLSDRPDEALIKLFQSNVELHPKVRSLMADAFAVKRKPGVVRLEVKGCNAGNEARALRLRKERIQQGIRVLKLTAMGLPFKQALQQIAAEDCKGEKSIELSVTSAKKARAWAETRRAAMGGQLNWGDEKEAYDGIFVARPERRRARRRPRSHHPAGERARWRAACV